MVYIQQAGRVLRTHDTKTDALILDHAGNTEAHGFVTDELPQELNDGTKQKQKATKAQEKPKGKICPSCSFVKPAKVWKCPCCGFAPKTDNPGIESAQGELQEISRLPKITMQDKQTFYSELLYIELEKNYKRGFAANNYRNKFGVWPKGLKDLPVPASEATRSYVLSRMIRHGYKKRA